MAAGTEAHSFLRHITQNVSLMGIARQHTITMAASLATRLGASGCDLFNFYSKS